LKVESAAGARGPIDLARNDAPFSGDLVMESFVTSMPQPAAALSVCRPVASGADEVLAVGVPYLKSLAQASGLLA
jgi:hypothetical protein